MTFKVSTQMKQFFLRRYELLRLAFVQLKEAINSFELLTGEFADDDGLTALLDYCETGYIGRLNRCSIRKLLFSQPSPPPSTVECAQ